MTAVERIRADITELEADNARHLAEIDKAETYITRLNGYITDNTRLIHEYEVILDGR